LQGVQAHIRGTPNGYITSRRLERAKDLMLEGNEPLSVIAVLCGFTDQAHLSRLFKQNIGQPPGAWRRTARKNSEIAVNVDIREGLAA
jgi:transcriptional regulator GlxA family with amidase domain